MTQRKSSSGCQTLSHLFIWANLTSPYNPLTINHSNGRPYTMPECFALQFIQQIEDPIYAAEMLNRPIMAMALLDYFVSPQPNAGDEFNDLGRQAVTKFLSKSGVIHEMLSSRDVNPFLLELIAEKLDEFDKYEILKVDGALSSIMFFGKVNELALVMENMSDHLIESLLQLPQTIITLEKYGLFARPYKF